MRSIKELNKAADEATKSVMTTINAIVDELSFVECDRFVLSETTLGDAIGEGVVSGFASVNDVQTGIFAINGEVLKGSIGIANAAKITKCVYNAAQTGSPVIGIIDTMGMRFSEGINGLDGYAAITDAFASVYGSVPTILIVKGNNFGSLAYLSALTDFTICYEKSVIATSSPLILAAGTTLDEKTVGTAEAMAKDGIASFVVKSDAEAAAVVKSLFDLITEDIIEPTDDGNRVCKGLKDGVGVEKIIAEIFDKNTFVEIKKAFAVEVVTGFARLNGITVGVVANNSSVNDGRLTPNGAKKVLEFINTCDSFAIPLVNLVDTLGAVNCAKCQGELIRAIGDMIYGYSVTRGAKIALVTGKAIGLGYTAFAAKSVCDYTIAWDSANIGAMDSVAAAELVYAKEIAASKDKEKATAELAKAYSEENTSAITVAENGCIDNVISPNLSRQYLIAAVQAFINKR